MKVYKKISLLITIIIIIILAAILYLNLDKADLSDNTLQSTEGNTPRIPKLEEGVNVYQLENDIFSILGPESIRISTDRSSGSGILWKNEKNQIYALTAAHLVSDFSLGEMELWGAEKVPFKIENVVKDKVYDVAIIRIMLDEDSNKSIFKAEYDGAAAYVASEESVLNIGDKIWVMDSVYGAASGIGAAQVASVDIFLEDYQAEMLLLYGEGKVGMSGSPVYDEEGFLVGMVSGMSEDRSALAVVPMNAIMKFLETLK